MATAEEVWYPLVQKIKAREDEFAELHEYWMAEQDLPVSSAEFQSRFGIFFAGFRDNLARPVIDTAEGRVRIKFFGSGDPDDELSDTINDIWMANRMKVESRFVHTDAMVFGSAFVIVAENEDGTPGIFPQITTQCAVLYDDIDPRKRIVGMKYWVEDLGEANKEDLWVRVNLYFDDRIERYISKTGSNHLEERFDRYEEYDADEAPPSIPHEVGECPMFEFNANFDMRNQASRSDLADALPLIDAINKTLLDMLVASEYTAAPQRWATGVEIPLDPQTGEPMQTYRSGADRLWTAPNEQARFGQFEAGALSAYKEAIETLVDHLAFITRTPQYALFKMANYPSGEALKTVEAGLRDRVQDHQDEFGAIWAEVMRAAVRIAGGPADTPLSDLMPTWLPPNAPFATLEQLEELKVKSEVLGIPDEQLWIEAGYTPDQIERMKTMREEDAAVGLEASLASEALLFGQPPPTSSPVPDAGLAPEA